jgi:hypothetical protein
VAVVTDGRRSVPPAERPNAAVTAKKRRERPRPRRANPAPRPSSGVAHASRVRVHVGDGRGHIPSRDRVGNAPRNDDHFPARARQRLTGATRAGFPGSNVFDECARICRRSGLDCPVALGRVKTARRSTSALRGLDPPGALPMFGNYRSDAVDSDDNRPPICRSFAHASGRLQSCPLTNHASRPDDCSHDVLVPRLVLVLHGGRCRVR